MMSMFTENWSGCHVNEGKNLIEIQFEKLINLEKILQESETLLVEIESSLSKEGHEYQYLLKLRCWRSSRTFTTLNGECGKERLSLLPKALAGL